jgi:predicted nuclease of predicted toxin-antitoxin system
MKLLLDENLPVDLRHAVTGHDCQTVRYNQWNGKRNGELLTVAAAAGFDALLTRDSNLPYQQGVSLPLAVVVLNAPSNKLHEIVPLIPALLKALETLRPKAITFVP